jgi:hypothetical protein
MATFIVLKRPGPPTRKVLENQDEILMVQPGQGTGSAILFGREHLISFEEDSERDSSNTDLPPYRSQSQIRDAEVAPERRSAREAAREGLVIQSTSRRGSDVSPAEYVDFHQR